MFFPSEHDGASELERFKVKPIDNTLPDGTRTVRLKLKASPTGDYNVGTAKKATILILDDDSQ